mgnify:CR=1 FL=1
MAVAAAPIAISDTHQVADGATETYTTIDVNNGGTLGIARNAKVTNLWAMLCIGVLMHIKPNNRPLLQEDTL